MNLQSEIAKIFQGELDTSDETREFYSHDASLFELKPQLVAFPKGATGARCNVKIGIFSFIFADKLYKRFYIGGIFRKSDKLWF